MFECTEECAISLQQLKYFLTSSLVLKIVDLDKEFVVCTYACKEGLGGFMMHGGSVVCYESRKLNENENNYVVHDVDLRVIIHLLKMWRHYLLGAILTCGPILKEILLGLVDKYTCSPT